MRRVAALLLLLLLAPTAQAFLVGTQPYAATQDYAPGLRADAASFTFLSGAVQATLPGVAGAFGFFNVQPTTLHGVEQVCFMDGTNPPCRTSPSGAFTLSISPGGAFAVDFPGPADATLAARHALGLFVDFQGDRDLKALNLQKTLVASTIGGTTTFTALPGIAMTSAQTAVQDANTGAVTGRWVGLNGATQTIVTDGAFTRTIAGSVALLFQGSHLSLDPVRAPTLVAPFEAASRATWTPATAADAVEGLDLGKLSAVIDDINGASSKGGASDGINVGGLDSLKPILARVLNGAIMRVPTQAAGPGDVVKGLQLTRLERLTVASDGSRLRLAGDAALVITGGRVQGAEPLYGFSFLELPWWSYLLWVLAIGAFITRLVLGEKAPKANERWDRLRWIGWVAGPLAFLLLFWVWDLTVQDVWGTSVLDGLTHGFAPESFLVLLAIDVAPFLLMLFAVASPLRLLIRSGLRIGRQGSFMRLSSAAAYLLSIFLGMLLLLSYNDYALQQLLGA